METELYGEPGHDAAHPPGNFGCTDAAVVAADLNSGACHDVVGRDSWTFCFAEVWGGSCAGPGTPLSLHYTLETGVDQPIRCVVVADAVGIDDTQTDAVRARHIWWGPWDVNRDGTLGDPVRDALWILNHARWVTGPNGFPVNLNRGTQSFRLYDEYCGCLSGCRYDEGWRHLFEFRDDALYLGVCYLNP
jgi:hypothetical protein